MPFIFESIQRAESADNNGIGEYPISDIIVIKADFLTGQNIVIRTGDLSTEEGILYGA